MVQLQTPPVAADGDERESLEMYMLLYPKELEDEIIQAVESTGVPGYTEMPKMIGRGRHTKHFDNSVWPGATGCIFTVLTPREAKERFLPTFQALAASLDTRSHGLYGLHIFALPCAKLI